MHYDASILLVDDYKFIRTILERMLQRLGYQNLCMAFDGVEALNLLRPQPVDLVITDYHMPEMDGIGGALWAVRPVRHRRPEFYEGSSS
ncbi:MAG: response regulator [SAR324 cluster bacterium]|nr:response regulator [SAR324 cluster bacterium]